MGDALKAGPIVASFGASVFVGVARKQAATLAPPRSNGDSSMSGVTEWSCAALDAGSKRLYHHTKVFT